MKFDDSIDDELKGWLRLDNWTPREAFLLLCGANPRFDGCPLHPLQCRAESFGPSEAFDDCEKLEESWRRGSHNINSNSPAYYIEWAQAHGFGVWWLGEVDHDEQQEEASVATQPPDVATDNVPLMIRGDTMERIRRAVNAFPTAYPEFRSRVPKLQDDLRAWLKETELANTDREAFVFSAIIQEHFKF
jgi:hypothetical protein